MTNKSTEKKALPHIFSFNTIMGERLEFQEKIFDAIMTGIFILYIIVALGLSASAPMYLSTLEYYIRIYVSIFLLYRFNPFRRIKFTELDRKIAFNAGLFLITTTALNQILENFKTEIKEFALSIINLNMNN